MPAVRIGVFKPVLADPPQVSVHKLLQLAARFVAVIGSHNDMISCHDNDPAVGGTLDTIQR
jgi:hypothetical protein